MHHDSATLPILLKELGLLTILETWENFLEKAKIEGWSYNKLFSILLEQEVETRHRKKVQAYLRKAHLPPGKSLTTFDFSQVQPLNKAKVEELAFNTAWIKRSENLLIFGPSGVGKSHLAAAIGYALVEHHVKVLFISTTKLVQLLQAARKEYRLPNELTKLDKYDVIILDDIGYGPYYMPIFRDVRTKVLNFADNSW